MSTNLDEIKKPIKRTKAYKAISKNLNYRSVKGYSSTQNIAVNLAAQTAIAQQYLDGNLSGELAKAAEGFSAKMFLYAAKKVENQLVPCYWLASELAESLKITDIPDNWQGLKPFIDRGFLLLPKGCVEYSGFGETESIDWLYFEVMVIPEELRSDNMSAEPVILWTSSSDRLSLFAGIIDLSENIKIGANSEKERDIIERVSKLLLNTMLVLNYKPELLDKQKNELKGVGFGLAGKLPSNIARNPVWIGRVYSQDREYSKPLGKLVRPSREHYRRGHWARRRHGTREKWQYQWHWIEPTVVNQVE
jgi:hypothetical protein